MNFYFLFLGKSKILKRVAWQYSWYYLTGKYYLQGSITKGVEATNRSLTFDMKNHPDPLYLQQYVLIKTFSVWSIVQGFRSISSFHWFVLCEIGRLLDFKADINMFWSECFVNVSFKFIGTENRKIKIKDWYSFESILIQQ